MVIAFSRPVSLEVNTKCWPSTLVIMVAKTDSLSSLSLIASLMSDKVSVLVVTISKVLSPEANVKVPSPNVSVSPNAAEESL